MDGRDANKPRRASRPRALPFAQGDLVEGEVTALARRGGAEGVAAGVPLRVTGGVPGDRGVLRVLHVGRNIVQARFEDLREPSPDRVQPECGVVDRCGGCPWQAASIDAQRRARDAAIDGAVGSRLEGARRHPWPGEPVRVGYRTRALMMARHRGGRLRLGFYAAGTNDLVPAEGCAVQYAPLSAALQATARILDRRGVPTWRSPERPGLLRAVSLRLDPVDPVDPVDPSDPAGLLTLVTTRHDPELRAIAAELLRTVPAIAGVFLHVNDAPGGAVLGPDTEHIAGAHRQVVTCGELRLEVGPTAFLQTHPGVAAQLLQVLDELLPARADHLVDAFSGVGLLGLGLRHRARRVTLIERDPAAAADARHNVERLGTRRVDVVEADAAAGVVALASASTPVDAVILDPPRAGAGDAVIQALAAQPTVRHVVLVSCGLPGLARDLAALTARGFRATDVVPLDMFVHTPHVEVVVALERGG